MGDKDYILNSELDVFCGNFEGAKKIKNDKDRYTTRAMVSNPKELLKQKLYNNEQELKQIVEAVYFLKTNMSFETCPFCHNENFKHNKGCSITKAQKLLKEIWGG